MPAIEQSVIDSVFFLYMSEAEAQAGNNAQGTGFLVMHEGQLYAVSNHHVAVDGGASCVRLNLPNGGVKIIPDEGSLNWAFDLTLGDIAAMPIFLPKDEALALEMKAAYTSSMIQKSWHDSYAVGDDVYMIGMFANHQGKVRNNPLARFGNISMVASDDSLVEHARNRIHNRPAQYEAHIVDMHSRSGYSGSPVFAYRPYGKRLTPSGAYEIDFDGASHHLLGIHYGSFQEPVKLSDAKLIDTEALRAELGAKASIDVTTGMTCVAPTWKIVELLDGNELTAKRKHAA